MSLNLCLGVISTRSRNRNSLGRSLLAILGGDRSVHGACVQEQVKEAVIKMSGVTHISLPSALLTEEP